MILNQTVVNLDGVAEGHKDLYTANADGTGFVLNGVIGMKTQGDIDTLTKSLQAERTAHGDTKTALKGFNGVDVKTITSDLAELDSLRITGGKVDDKTINDAVDAKVRQMTGPLESKITDLTESNAQFALLNSDYLARDTKRTIEDDARKSFQTLELKDAGSQEDVMLHINQNFKLQDGGAITNSDWATITEWLSGMRNTRANWWGATVSDGANGGTTNYKGQNPFSHEHWNMSAQNSLIKSDRTQADALVKAAGTTFGVRPSPKKV